MLAGVGWLAGVGFEYFGTGQMSLSTWAMV
jgi:hypothetical protein